MSGRIVVVSEGRRYDVYIGRGRCPRSGSRSPWSMPPSIRSVGEEASEEYRRWLWSAIRSGLVPVQSLVALNGKVFGVRAVEEAVHASVLRSAALWAMAEQARRLERVFEDRRQRFRAGGLPLPQG